MAYWSDIDISLDKKNDGDIKDSIDLDALTNSLTNIVNTFQGSRRMLPTFAFNGNNYLFDPLDKTTAYDIANTLLETIRIWEDRVEVTNFLINANYDYHRYDIHLTFRIKGFTETKTIETFLYPR